MRTYPSKLHDDKARQTLGYFYPFRPYPVVTDQKRTHDRTSSRCIITPPSPVHMIEGSQAKPPQAAPYAINVLFTCVSDDDLL